MKLNKPLTPNDPRHGTYNAYHNYGCRCEPCTAANADYCWRGGWTTRYNRRHGIKPLDQHLAEIEAPHGTESRYTSPRFKCRCDLCREAAAEARRERRHANPEVRLRENAKRMERYYLSKDAAA